MRWCHDNLNERDHLDWVGSEPNYCVHKGNLYHVWNNFNHKGLFISKSQDGVNWSHPYGLVGKTGWSPVLLSVRDTLMLFYTDISEGSGFSQAVIIDTGNIED